MLYTGSDLSAGDYFRGIIIMVAIWLVHPAATYATPDGMELQRRASWQARFAQPQPGSPGAVVRELDKGSPLDRAGLKAGDRVIQVNGKAITTAEQWNDITDALVATSRYRLLVRRKAVSLAVDVAFEPLPTERYPGIHVEYDQIINDYGLAQRTIITRPASAKGKLPAVFVVQGLSCSSIERTPERQSNFITTLSRLVEQSGMVVYRVEKPGLGDSEGDCSETDFNVELNGYEVALQALLALPYVDASRVLVYGASMGSAIAPYLVNKYDLNAMIADGTFYKSWFEHMVEIERRIKQMSGQTDASIHQHLNQVFIPLFYGLLIERKSFDQLAASRPLLQQAYPSGMSHLYGRPMRYYQQLQHFNVAGEWEKLTKPVRIRWGTNDWIMSEQDNDLIVATLTRKQHPDFKLHKQPGLDHWYTLHETAVDSFSGKSGQWQEETAAILIEWIRALNAKPH